MKFCKVCLLACTFLFALTENCLPQSPMVPWLTRSADNSRSGWNSHETQRPRRRLSPRELSEPRSFP
jgi:hypothetical protein